MEYSINGWAVLIAAIANMVVGMLWYGPLFGKQWKRLMGFTDESMRGMAMMPARAMSFGLASSLVMAYVLAHFADAWVALDFSGAFQLAFWIWLGFVATTQLSGVLWEGKSWKLFCLNTTASLVSMVAMAWVLVSWR